MRITPRLNESVNEEWLSDKGRFSYDGLKRQRLNIPLVKTPKGFQTVLWPDALKAVAEGLKDVKGSEMKAIAGKLADAEAMVALKVTDDAGSPETPALLHPATAHSTPPVCTGGCGSHAPDKFGALAELINDRECGVNADEMSVHCTLDINRQANGLLGEQGFGSSCGLQLC